MAFTCPRCGAVSHHPMDEREGYCGRCHDWTGVCDCGHPLSDHAHSGWGRHTVCTVKLDDPDSGWHGVCPCVRTNAP